MGTQKIDDWAAFLRTWSDEWHEVHDEPPGRLGFDPATDEEIAALEACTGTPLPPSYRAFLKVSNGWRWAGEFVDLMAGTTQVARYEDVGMSFEAFDEWAHEDLGEDPDEDELFAAEMWRRALQLSVESDMNDLMLDPEDINEDGEWAAYDYASWRASPPERYESFGHLMYALYQSFHNLRNPEGATADRLDAQIEQARLDLLAGRLDEAVAALEDAKAFGRPAADVYLFQTRVMQGSTYMLPDPRRLLPADGHFLTKAVLPVYALLAEREDHGHTSTDPALAPYRRRFLDGTFEPACVAAVPRARELAIWGQEDEAWEVLAREVLPLWRPLTAEHIAPVELLADPYLGPLITPERARSILTTPREGGSLDVEPTPAPSDGIDWLPTHVFSSSYALTFTRAHTAQELARRLGADPDSVLPAPAVSRSRLRQAFTPNRERPTAVFGSCGNGWSFALENTGDRPATGDLSVPGVTIWQRRSDALHVTCTGPGGEELCTLAVEPGFPGHYAGTLSRTGTEPALLDPALTEAGLLDAEGRFTDVWDEGHRGRTAAVRTLRAVGSHFGLTLPRIRVENHRLPVLDTPDRPKPEPVPGEVTVTIGFQSYDGTE
ncbi:SMI1/KNR4 family protein [Streptomyces sp. NBC_01465]|uniref:SMI1/KNR4 family protein n=1 Tax=Streptomyces sp. NBC_01465 TaxID=2903878 RepID=UPI002E3382D7|nr:SMI1/KNR4 family protein [Streptomyces sp. NBC_01465]